MVSGIYRIRNTANNDCYYGSTVDFKVRWRRHRTALRRGKHKNAFLQNVWLKYGEASFVFEVVLYCERPDLLTHEQRFLDEGLGRYNISLIAGAGTSGTALIGKPFSEEHKKKLSLAHLGKRLSEETKKKMSIANTGKRHSDEAKQKISARMSGERHPMYGKHHSDEAKKKIGANNFGKQHPGELSPNFGKRHSEETKQKMREGQAAYRQQTTQP